MADSHPDEEMTIRVTKNGPYLVTGSVPLAIQRIVADPDGESVDWEQGEALPADEQYLLCRCGQSANKPFCDTSHRRVGFNGTETASREPYLEQAESTEGPIVRLTDARPLCAFARFCDYGDEVWNLVEQPDEQAGALAVREATMCPSGRLIAWDRGTDEAFEPTLEPSIGLIQDPAMGVSGPLWVRGRIAVVSSDGHRYERRNRMTLCRCGASQNKPFCDGSHATIGFSDGLDGDRPDA